MVIFGFQVFFASAIYECKIMAILIISAALPCIGALMALRSAKPRVVMLRELMSRR
jgi:hypothetical protein